MAYVVHISMSIVKCQYIWSYNKCFSNLKAEMKLATKNCGFDAKFKVITECFVYTYDQICIGLVLSKKLNFILKPIWTKLYKK